MSYTVNVNQKKCVGCTICARVCPTGTLKIDKQNKKAYTTDVTCDNAWGCIVSCPTRALTIVEAE